MTLVERVKSELDAARGEATYLQLYKRTGLDPGYAHRLTRSPMNLTLKTLERVANALGYDVEIRLVERAGKK